MRLRTLIFLILLPLMIGAQDWQRTGAIPNLKLQKEHSRKSCLESRMDLRLPKIGDRAKLFIGIESGMFNHCLDVRNDSTITLFLPCGRWYFLVTADSLTAFTSDTTVTEVYKSMILVLPPDKLHFTK